MFVCVFNCPHVVCMHFAQERVLIALDKTLEQGCKWVFMETSFLQNMYTVE